MQTSISEDRALLLVLGMGYSASRFLQHHRGMFDRVAACARSLDKAAHLTASGIDAFVLGREMTEGLRVAAEASHVLVSIPPGTDGDPALKVLGESLRSSRNLRWVGYLSTTAVYGDREGAPTDEAAPVNPQSERARRRAEAEEDWRSLATDGRAVQIFRLSGIYGPGRNALAELKAGTARRVTKPGQVFNRIHVDDIAQVLAAAIRRPQAGPIFNLADEQPAPSHEVVTFAANLLGIEPPPLTPFDEADMSDMARSFWAENKRITAKKIEAELGVDLLFPTYREGLLALFAAGEGR